MSLTTLLNELDAELIKQGLHTPDRPSDEALASTQPFAIDTMSFTCWLQWIFIEKMRQVIDAGGPLPQPCHISEMGEMYAREAHFPAELVQLLKRIDDCINDG